MSDHPQHPTPPDAESDGSAAPSDPAVPREWVPVTPHPENASPELPAARRGTGIAVGSLATGLASLFTAVVALFFAPLVGGAVAVLLGIIALVLGIIGLVQRSTPRPAMLTGLVTGLLGVIFGIATGVWALTAFLTFDADAEPVPVEGDTWSSEEQPQQLIAWPANMATGGMLFGANAEPIESAPLQPGEAPVPNTVNRSEVADVLIYVDYSCPHCLSFEQANGSTLTHLLESGSATVEIVPLTFLDRASGGAYYSSRAAGAMACIADAQPESAWAAHGALLSPDVQPSGDAIPTNDELISVLDARTGGLNGEATACISEERFVPFAQALNDWVFATTVPNAVDEELTVTGTPFVTVNGRLYQQAPDDAAAFDAFVAEMIGG